MNAVTPGGVARRLAPQQGKLGASSRRDHDIGRQGVDEQKTGGFRKDASRISLYRSWTRARRVSLTACEKIEVG